MKKFIKGKRYNFIVEFSSIQSNYYFSIEAIDLKRKTHSFINNLNYILSELQLEEEDPRVADSDWEVSKKEGERFFLDADDFLNGEMNIMYLENQLDLDQELGEWNRIKHKKFHNLKH